MTAKIILLPRRGGDIEQTFLVVRGPHEGTWVVRFNGIETTRSLPPATVEELRQLRDTIDLALKISGGDE